MSALPKEPERLEFVYELEGIEEIDVFQFAPILMSLGRLIQESNRTMYPHLPDISVKIRPFKKASFLTEIIVQAVAIAPLLPQVAESAKQIKEVLATIGIIAGVPASVLGVIRKLKGKVEKVEQLKPGEIHYQSGGTTIIVNGNVHNLLQNSVVRADLESVLAKPLDQPHVTGVKSFLKGHEEDSKTVSIEDADSIRRFVREEIAQIAPPSEPETRESIVMLNPHRGSFTGEGGRWIFRRGDATITATLKDQGFLERQARGVYRLHGSDLLRVRLIETQRITGTEVKVNYEIAEVLEYIPGHIQRGLLWEGESE